MRLVYYPAVLAIVIAPVAVQAAKLPCDYESVTFAGHDHAGPVACDALDAVTAYFEKIGHRVEPNVHIAFQDEVWIDRPNSATPRLQVSACYEPAARTIRITDWNGRATDRQPWGLPWNKVMVRSVLEHELVHMSVNVVLRERSMTLGSAWHELVAYAIQITLMPSTIRDQVLQRHPDLKPFADPGHINQLIYSADPDIFALRSYLYMQASGGDAFIRAILEDEAGMQEGETDHICR